MLVKHPLCEERVEEVLAMCLYNRAGDHPTARIVTVGIYRPYELHAGRLRSFGQEITRMLGELPECFRDESGGSFSQIRDDRYGRQWADQYRTASRLIILGMATGQIEYRPSPCGYPAIRLVCGA